MYVSLLLFISSCLFYVECTYNIFIHPKVCVYVCFAFQMKQVLLLVVLSGLATACKSYVYCLMIF